jgi:putative peptidoglycan lipid II flippase
MAYGSAVWAYSVNQVLTRAFYAAGDTRTPMRVALAMIASNCVLNFTLIWFLREAGIAWATAASATLQCVLLTALLPRTLKTPVIVDRDLARSAAVTLMISVLMGAGVWATLAALPAEGWSASVVRLAAATGVGAAIYAVGAVALKRPEPRWLLDRSR